MSLMTARPSSSKFVVEDPCFLSADERPDWQNQFKNDHPLKLEIGFGMGDFLLAMALKEPQSNFIGIDFSQNGILKLLAQIQVHQLKNIRIVYGDVREKIPLLFRDGELDTVYINFPDPWPRKRHFKRRLIKPALVELIAQKLAGHVYLATDSEPYALEAREYFNAESSLKNVNGEPGFLLERDFLPKTKYEKSFIYAGDNIYYLAYFRDDGKTKKPVEKIVETVSASASTATNNDELLTEKFKQAEAKAKDACDLKQVADQLAEAGDRQWARKVYKKAEGKAEDSLDLNWLAYSVSATLDDKQWAGELYKKAEEQAESSLDLNWLAYSIVETLGDQDWAKKLFEKADANPQNIRELCDLVDSIVEILADRPWARKVCQKAESKAQDYSDFYELADTLYTKLEDAQWARQVYRQAEDKAEDCSDLLGLAEHIMEKFGDNEWARKVYGKAQKKAEDRAHFCELAESIQHYLRDEEWAEKIRKQTT